MSIELIHISSLAKSGLLDSVETTSVRRVENGKLLPPVKTRHIELNNGLCSIPVLVESHKGEGWYRLPILKGWVERDLRKELDLLKVPYKEHEHIS